MAPVKTTSPIRVALFAALGLGLLPLPAARAQNAGNVRVSRLSRAEGQVLVSHGNSGTWEEAPVNLPLQQGEALATQDGLAVIEFEDGATVFLAGNSVLQFTQLGFSGGGRATDLTLTQGAGTFNASLTNQDSFRVQTLTFDVTIPQRAEFRVDAFQDGAAVEVFNGSVSVSTTKGSTDVAKGQSVAVHENDFQDLYRGRLPNPDPFDQWVIQEGERIRSGNNNTLSYINSPNSYGLSELAIYGTWINYTEFGGFIWRPFSAGLSWTPYLNGSWRLDPLLGWVWVSSEQWGWMPYHFGAWQLSPVLGWVWVPGGATSLNQWQAARVNWVSLGNHVGWVAMSPNDRDGVSANAPHGVVTTSSESPKNGIKQNEIVSGKDLRILAPLKHPPQDFASTLALGSAGLGARPPIRTVPQTSYDTDTTIHDQQTHAVMNASNPPVAPAVLMPQSRSEVPRVTVTPRGATDSQANRDFPQSPYLPGSAARGSVPAHGLAPRPSMSNPPTSPPHSVVPPLMPRPVAPPPTQAQPVVSRTAPAQKSSAARPAAQGSQPSAPQAPTH